MATIGEAIADATQRLRAAGSETARLDAELLLGWAIGADRTSTCARRDAPVGADALRPFEAAVARRGIDRFGGSGSATGGGSTPPRDAPQSCVHPRHQRFRPWLSCPRLDSS